MPNHSYPIINLSGSSRVREINEEIKQRYAEEDDEYSRSEYKYYLNNDILSLIIKHTGPTDGWAYNVYNINVKTGKKVSNAELLKVKNIDETTLITKIKELCKEKFIEAHNKYPRNGTRT